MTAAVATRPSTAAATLTSIDRAIASDDWQAAYDSAMTIKIGSAGALKRLLRVADELHQRGASDAALDLLDRGIDTYAGTPQLYYQLVQVLVALDREEDAQLALELLKGHTTAV
jgi:hypothetical protein